MEIGHMTFKNWKKTGAGSLNFADALTQSCDTWFYQVGIKTGSYKILADVGDIAGGLILEPKGLDILLVETDSWKDSFYYNIFDLKKKRMLHDPTSYPLVSEPNAISPDEDHLLFIIDAETSGCAPENPYACVDYGRYLQSLEIVVPSAKNQNADFQAINFARLPKGYTYAESLYPPNLMADGLRSAGKVTWTAAWIKVNIYSDAKDIDYGDPPRTPLRTISVTFDQADVKLK